MCQKDDFRVYTQVFKVKEFKYAEIFLVTMLHQTLFKMAAQWRHQFTEIGYNQSIYWEILQLLKLTGNLSSRSIYQIVRKAFLNTTQVDILAYLYALTLQNRSRSYFISYHYNSQTKCARRMILRSTPRFSGSKNLVTMLHQPLFEMAS